MLVSVTPRFVAIVALATLLLIATTTTVDAAPKNKPGSRAKAAASEPNLETAEPDSPQPEELPILTVRVLDSKGKPIDGAVVLLLDPEYYSGTEKEAFEPISEPTEEDGRAAFPTYPHEGVRVQVLPQDSLAGNYVVLHEGEMAGVDPLVQLEADAKKEQVTLTFTLRQPVGLEFKVVDAQTDEALENAVVQFKDDRVKDWTTLAWISLEQQHNFTTIVEEMSKSTYRVVLPGYFAKEFKVTKGLRAGKPLTHRVAMEPAPAIQFTVLDADGEPVEGADCLHVVPPLTQSGSGENLAKTDENGIVVMRYPGLDDNVRYEITHPSGSAEVALKDLPEPTIVGEGEKGQQVILHEIQLTK